MTFRAFVTAATAASALVFATAAAAQDQQAGVAELEQACVEAYNPDEITEDRATHERNCACVAEQAGQRMNEQQIALLTHGVREDREAAEALALEIGPEGLQEFVGLVIEMAQACEA